MKRLALVAVAGCALLTAGHAHALRRVIPPKARHLGALVAIGLMAHAHAHAQVAEPFVFESMPPAIERILPPLLPPIGQVKSTRQLAPNAPGDIVLETREGSHAVFDPKTNKITSFAPDGSKAVEKVLTPKEVADLQNPAFLAQAGWRVVHAAGEDAVAGTGFDLSLITQGGNKATFDPEKGLRVFAQDGREIFALSPRAVAADEMLRQGRSVLGRDTIAALLKLTISRPPNGAVARISLDEALQPRGQ